jgi:CMP-N,N'-diacetyllegionaminic acid synthase
VDRQLPGRRGPLTTLALIPARGGSKGLPGKNVRRLAGLPLVVHSLRLAARCPEVDRTVVSTDSADIADVARAAGGEVLERPATLAADETPMVPVLRHALDALDPTGSFDFLLLLDPTSPGRLPDDVTRAHDLLVAQPEADGVVAVSEPPFNPIWHAVVDRDGFMEQLFPEARSYGRRQDVPRVLRINAALYLFRTSFVRSARDTWLDGRHLVLEVPDLRALHIDTETDFRLCELLLEAGLVTLPWIDDARDERARD